MVEAVTCRCLCLPCRSLRALTPVLEGISTVMRSRRELSFSGAEIRSHSGQSANPALDHLPEDDTPPDPPPSPGLQMLRYVLTERPGDRAAAGDAALVPRLAALLMEGDPDVVEAALGVASTYAQPPEQVQYLREVR